MSSTTVAEFANELKKSPETLLEQLRTAGVSKRSSSDNLTESDKQQLLSFLQASHGTTAVDRKKITLVKKSTSEIKQADATGKARTIQVEVRKKRTFIKRDDAAPSAEEAAEPVVSDADLARREEEAQAQAVLLREQEEALAEKRRVREEQEALLWRYPTAMKVDDFIDLCERRNYFNACTYLGRPGYAEVFHTVEARTFPDLVARTAPA